MFYSFILVKGYGMSKNTYDRNGKCIKNFNLKNMKQRDQLKICHWALSCDRQTLTK